MCGIAGFFSYNSNAPAPSVERLERLCKSMYRRGPDAKGQWSSMEGRVLLGHRRLSILDLSENANQPMVDEVSGCALVFNGEIYNFRELRIELEQRGYSFRSEGDSEVLLKGYIHWGEDVLGKLRGMFAFALWDPVKRGLCLARDPYGIKPLYYADHAGCFAFASQVKPLRAHVEADNDPDPAGVVGFMLLGSMPEPYTCYRGIRSISAGHSVWVSAEGVSSVRPYASVTDVWCSAAQVPERLDETALLKRVRVAMKGSVAAHQVADVPVGAFLSAGIDSGAIVGLMAEHRSAPLQTTTLGFERFRGTALDEVAHAERLASCYGSQQQTVWITDQEAEADFSEMLADMDQPSIDGFNTWLVSKHTAARGLKVVVSGVGGDELFGGYTNFTRLPRWHRRIKQLGAFPGLLPLLSGSARIASRCGLVHAKAEGLTRLGRNLTGLYLVQRGLFMPWELPQFLDGDLLREGLLELQSPMFSNHAMGDLPTVDYAAIAALEASCYLRNQLLRDSDWASMAHSLELRTPLVDFQLLCDLAPVLVHRPAGLPGKRPLALAPDPPLPEEVIRRRKSGFSLPMDRWMERSDVLSGWRGNRHLRKAGIFWTRRMAYSLMATTFPEAAVSQ
jgi:asparagine synthase (glutamine-hydrolysing)